MTASGILGRVETRSITGIVGGEGRGRRRQLVITWQAVLAGEDIDGSSKSWPRPASTFAPADVPVVEQIAEGVCEAAHRLVHVCYLQELNEILMKETF